MEELYQFCLWAFITDTGPDWLPGTGILIGRTFGQAANLNQKNRDTPCGNPGNC